MAKQLFIKGTLPLKKGEWTYIHRGTGQKPSAEICCPDCGRGGSLLSHDINDDGIITPSLVCPHDDCGYHEWGILKGWDSNPVISGELDTDYEDEDTEETTVPGKVTVPPGQDPDEPGFKP
jgi:hypothetical protein